MTTTRRAVWVAGRDFRLEEQPIEAPGPGQVRVRVHTCGVCLTDVHYTEGKLGDPTSGTVLGHEWSGTIEAVGAAVAGLPEGTPVAGIGQGGYAERLVVSSSRVFPIPPSVPVERGAFVEPLAACLAGVKRAELPLGGTVLVTGAGTMGLMTLQLALRAGAARAIVSEPNPSRRAAALRLGADQAVDPREGGLAEAVAALTAGAGVAAALETAGHPAALDDCLDAAAEWGSVIMIGVHPVATRLDFPVYRFHRRNLTLRGSYGWNNPVDLRAAIQWLDQLELDSLVSHRFGLAEVAEAFDVARQGQAGKVLVTVQQGG